MLKIEAIFRPEKLEIVCAKLKRVGYPGMMVMEMECHGRQGGLHSHWPQGMRVEFLPKVRMEIVIENKDQMNVLQAIMAGARTGEEGDGKIFITEIKEAIRIRTGERGIKALSKEKTMTPKKHELAAHN